MYVCILLVCVEAVMPIFMAFIYAGLHEAHKIMDGCLLIAKEYYYITFFVPPTLIHQFPSVFPQLHKAPSISMYIKKKSKTWD